MWAMAILIISIGMTVIGIFVGIGLSTAIFSSKFVGALHIDHSDPDGPYIFLELMQGVGRLEKERWVMLKVERNDLIPRE